MLLLIAFGLLALVFSFACSIFEAVLLSVTPSYVATCEQAETPKRRRTGRMLRSLKEDVDRPLAAILSLNTIAHTAGAAGVGAQAQHLWGSAAVTAASVVMTLLILVLSEIIPKTLGALYWRGLSGVVARLVTTLILVLYPFVLLARGLTRVLARGKRDAEVSREELGAMAEVGRREGVIDEEESRILRNMLRMKELVARDVMTPRPVAVMLREDALVSEALECAVEARFSRLPVFGKDRDDIRGYVLKSDLLLAGARDEFHRRVSDLKRPLMSVPETLPLPDVLERLLDGREHLALVVDEFGGTSGILTLEDVVETLLGTDIVDETDAAGDLRNLARERWRRRAGERGLAVEELAPSPGSPH
jgi:CBS domain containing-hemolysin-like protein